MKELKISVIIMSIIKKYLNMIMFLQLNTNITNNTKYIDGTIPYNKSVVLSLYTLLIGSIPVGILFLWLIYRSRKKRKNLHNF